ncbi:MAG: hypothetical protein J07HX64_00895 [halophilic archaeon J07HX64]|nr:MAG: hypothetical protein J07HX64_00895 [halophilic archaeon J07HX64]
MTHRSRREDVTIDSIHPGTDTDCVPVKLLTTCQDEFTGVAAPTPPERVFERPLGDTRHRSGTVAARCS